eukprot:TRINITY_DN6721_c0_g1_i3.p1 TRINITY_DN6721_c0_g1~~TRINITY_DN6721_c0_g1_i3.p1  ORF type:complete len:861 (+),score=154.95 TRINITY_DN6721_c0_g1_i3:82-2664(+)
MRMRVAILLALFCVICQADSVEKNVQEALLTRIKQRLSQTDSPNADSGTDDPNVPLTGKYVYNLPILPGSELLGCGINIRKGLDTSALTRSMFVMNTTELYRLGRKSYAYSPYVAVRRTFDTEFKTRVYNSMEEKMLDVAGQLQINILPPKLKIAGTATGQAGVHKGSNTRTVLSEAGVNVHLYDVYLNGLDDQQLHPRFLAEFDALPEVWEMGPLAFHYFIEKWGTHFLTAAQVGGSFRMFGTTTTKADVENFQIAAQLTVDFSVQIISISVVASVDWKRDGNEQRFQNIFDYKATGGDPAAAAMMVNAIKKASGNSEPAFWFWLDSLKDTPSIYSFQVKPLYEIVPGNGDGRREAKKVALQQALDVFLRESVMDTGTLALTPNEPVWSNYYRLDGECVRFAASIGEQDTLSVYFAAAPARKDRGYEVRINSQEVQVWKQSKLVKSTRSLEALAPGSNSLFSMYTVCYAGDAGALLYGRNRHITFVMEDDRPEPAYYYGFGTQGTQTVMVTSIQPMPLANLSCPAWDGTTCNTHGNCTELRTCACHHGWRGYACQLQCPMAHGRVCADNGNCMAQETQSQFATAYCQCNPGFFGEACQHPTPTLRIVTPSQPLVNSLDSIFEHSIDVDIKPRSWKWSVAGSDRGSTLQRFVTRLAPGMSTISLEVVLPGNPQPLTVSTTFEVKDCICTGRGKCDQLGRCVCNPNSIGTFCEKCRSGFVGPLCECQEYVTCKNGGRCNAAGKCCCPMRFSPASNCQQCALGRSGNDCQAYDEFVAADVRKISLVELETNIEENVEQAQDSALRTIINRPARLHGVWVPFFLRATPRPTPRPTQRPTMSPAEIAKFKQQLARYDKQETCPV